MLASKINGYIRVLKLTRKPSLEDFSRAAKIAAAGLIIVGFIGFLVFLAMNGLLDILGR